MISGRGGSVLHVSTRETSTMHVDVSRGRGTKLGKGVLASRDWWYVVGSWTSRLSYRPPRLDTGLIADACLRSGCAIWPLVQFGRRLQSGHNIQLEMRTNQSATRPKGAMWWEQDGVSSDDCSWWLYPQFFWKNMSLLLNFDDFIYMP